MHPYSQYGYAYAPGTTAPVAAADYTWGAAQYSWQTPPAHSPPTPNPLGKTERMPSVSHVWLAATVAGKNYLTCIGTVRLLQEHGR